jgi:hypothetical protein
LTYLCEVVDLQGKVVDSSIGPEDLSLEELKRLEKIDNDILDGQGRKDIRIRLSQKH